MPLNLSRFKNYFKNLEIKENTAAGVLNIFIKIIIGLSTLGLDLNINKNIFIIGVAI